MENVTPDSVTGGKDLRKKPDGEQIQTNLSHSTRTTVGTEINKNCCVEKIVELMMKRKGNVCIPRQTS